MSVITVAEIDGAALTFDPADVEAVSTPRDVGADGSPGKASIVVTFRDGAVPTWVPA